MMNYDQYSSISFDDDEDSTPSQEHSPGARESASTGSYAWRENPPTRMLIRKEDAASTARLKVQSGARAKSKRGKVGQCDPQRAASATRSCGDYKRGAKGHLSIFST